MGKGLTALDFEQLKIENIRSRKQLNEQNHKHLELKLLAGKTLQAMNSNKVRSLSHHQDICLKMFNCTTVQTTVLAQEAFSGVATPSLSELENIMALTQYIKKHRFFRIKCFGCDVTRFFQTITYKMHMCLSYRTNFRP